MKNITIAVDDETHRAARIRAAELGTSVSALVKSFLQELAAGSAPPASGVREMPATFTAAPKQAEGPPWLIDGKWVYTKDGKARKPGSLRHLEPLPDDLDEWPQDILESFEAWPYDDPDFVPWTGDEPLDP